MKTILAHRGITYKYCENTIESLCEIFNYVLPNYKFGIEFDINLSIDNQLFIYHDECINNIALHTLTYNQIKLLNNNIPLLTSLLDKFNNTNYILDIEIKDYPVNNHTTISNYYNIISNVVNQYNVDYFYSSFNNNICKFFSDKKRLIYKLSDIGEKAGDIVHYSEIVNTAKGVYTLFDKDFLPTYLSNLHDMDMLITDDIDKLLTVL